MRRWSCLRQGSDKASPGDSEPERWSMVRPVTQKEMGLSPFKLPRQDIQPYHLLWLGTGALQMRECWTPVHQAAKGKKEPTEARERERERNRDSERDYGEKEDGRGEGF